MAHTIDKPSLITGFTQDPTKPKGLVAGVLNLPPKFAVSKEVSRYDGIAPVGFSLTPIGLPDQVYQIPRPGIYRVKYTMHLDVVGTGVAHSDPQSNMSWWSRLRLNGVSDPSGQIAWETFSLLPGHAHGEIYTTYDFLHTLPAGPLALNWDYALNWYTNPLSHKVTFVVVRSSITGPENE